jgi:hypothetical protein
MKLHQLLFSTLLALVSVHAAAVDGTEATRRLFTNLQESKFDTKTFLATLNSSFDVATVIPSLVNGLHVVQRRNNGEPIFFTNAAGNILGASDGVYVIPPGQPPRKMNAEEQRQFSAEVMSNLRYDKLLKVGYGNGGGRRIVMFSAINCPACATLESNLQKTEAKLNQQGSSLNTTLYVVPSSLEPLEPNGWNSWKVAASLWCSGDQGNDWRGYWSKHVFPSVDIARCTLPTLEASRSRDALKLILNAVVGTPNDSVPQLVREDATILSHREVKALDYGPQGLPQTVRPSAVWLTSSPADDDQRIASRPIGKPDAKVVKTIKLSDMLKSLRQ